VKQLVDLGDEALERAKRHLGLSAIKATVNEALRLAAGHSAADDELDAALAMLAEVEFEDRSAAWR
jgi:Arc/MetJ family transcription regulator